MLQSYKLYWPFDEKISPLTTVKSSWSKKNWIALTPGFDKKETSFTNDVLCVFNPNEPWEMFRIKTHGGNIEQLLWDHSANSFVTVDSQGILKIWNKENHVLNSWLPSKGYNIGEYDKISNIMWVNHDSLSIDNDHVFTTKDTMQKFVSSKNKLLNNTTKENIESIVVITSTGLIKIIMINERNKITEDDVTVARLGSMDINVLQAHMTVNESGKLFVAVQTNRSVIELYTVSFKENNFKMSITVEAWPCIVPHLNNIQFEHFEIKSLKTVCFNLSDYIIVNSKGNGTSSIQIFEIKKEQVLLHAVFPKPTQHSQQSDTPVCLKTFQFTNDIVGLNTTNVKCVNITQNTSHREFSPKLFVIDSANTLYIFSLLDYSQLAKYDDIKFNGSICSIEISPCDHAMFIVTDESMFMFSIPFYSQDTSRTVSTMLQYCLHSDVHPWDILYYVSSLEISQIESILQSFIQEFNEQNTYIQHLLYKPFYSIKQMFYEITNNACGLSCCYCTVMFRQIYTYILSNASNENDSKVFEVLKKVCASKKDLDISKLPQVIDMKETNLALLLDTSNRPLIQWLYDYAIYIIRIILSMHYHGQNWKVIVKYIDASSILYLREALLLFYILYQKNTNLNHICPIFVTMASTVDITIQLFKFFTKIHQLCLGDNNIDISFADLPFNNLPLMYLEISNANQQNILSMSKKTKDLSNEFEVQLEAESWDYVQQSSMKNPLSNSVSTINSTYRQIFDGINLTNVSLMNDELVKQCCNCNTLTIHNAHLSRLFNINWKALFQEKCFCGGFWKKVDRKM